jgi:hypothetical protein
MAAGEFHRTRIAPDASEEFDPGAAADIVMKLRSCTGIREIDLA